MSRGMIYYLAGDVHCFYAAVSFLALRKYYRGPVAILAARKGDGLTLPIGAVEICVESRLDAEMVPINLMTAEGGNYTKGDGEFFREMVTKGTAHRHTPFDQTVFVDADTLPLADLSPLFDMTPCGGAVFTKRLIDDHQLEAWRTFAKAANCVELVEKHIVAQWPPINTGIYAWHKGATVFEPALALAIKGGTSVRWADQLGLQFCYPDHMCRLVGDEWNWSPNGLAKNPKILHSPGYRMTLGPLRKPWLAAFKEAWESNVANIRLWGQEEAQRWLAQV